MRHSELALLAPAVPLNGPAKMTSREIAELTGKDLSNVHRDIRNMLGALDDSVLKDVHEQRDSRGYTAFFALPKDLTITLVSGYSVPMRHRIVTRWMEQGVIYCGDNVRAPLKIGELLGGILRPSVTPRSLSMGPRMTSRPCMATWVA